MIDLKEILEKMNLNQKINYDKVMMKMVQNWQKEGIRPKILPAVLRAARRRWSA